MAGGRRTGRVYPPMRFRTLTRTVAILPLMLLLGLFSISPWRGAALEVDSAAVFAGPYGVGAQWVRDGGGSWIPSASMPAVEKPIEVRSLFKLPVVRLQGHMRWIIIP